MLVQPPSMLKQPPRKHFNDAVRHWSISGGRPPGLSGPQIAVAAAAAARAEAAALQQPTLPEGCVRARQFDASQVSIHELQYAAC